MSTRSKVGRELGALVQEKMREAGMTQRELGRRVRMGHSLLSRRFSGETAWADDDVAKIASALGVPASVKAEWIVLAKRSRGDRWSTSGNSETPRYSSDDAPVTVPGRLAWRKGTGDAREVGGARLRDGEHRLLVQTASMSPELADGDHVVVADVRPGADLRTLAGRLVAVTHQSDEGETVCIGRLVSTSASMIMVSKLSPHSTPCRIELPKIVRISLVQRLEREYTTA